MHICMVEWDFPDAYLADAHVGGGKVAWRQAKSIRRGYVSEYWFSIDAILSVEIGSRTALLWRCPIEGLHCQFTCHGSGSHLGVQIENVLGSANWHLDSKMAAITMAKTE